MTRKIKVGGVDINLWTDPGYNDPHTNERTIEIGLGLWFKEHFQNEVVELGAVIPYYDSTEHTVFDMHDPHKRAEKMDFTNLNVLSDVLRNKNVFSLSTIEHIGFNDYSKSHGKLPESEHKNGFLVLQKIIDNCRNYLITFPMNYNKVLDNLVENSNLKYTILKRIDEENNWTQERKPKKFKSREYAYQIRGKPKTERFWNASAICVLTNTNLLEKESQ